MNACELESANTANCIHQQSITLFVYDNTFIDKNLGATIEEKTSKFRSELIVVK